MKYAYIAIECYIALYDYVRKFMYVNLQLVLVFAVEQIFLPAVKTREVVFYEI